MQIRWRLAVPLLSLFVAIGCGRADESGKPSVESLRASLAEQIAGIEFVHDFGRKGDELTFQRPDGSGEEVSYRVHIDSAVVEPNDDAAIPYRGVITASWYLNDRLVARTGSISNLPMWIQDAGLGQECWAFWEEPAKRWDW